MTKRRPISALYRENGYQIDKTDVDTYLSQATEDSVGEALKELLKPMAQQNDKDLLDKLDKQLVEPPDEETAAIELLISLPLVITGCIAQPQYRIWDQVF